MPSKKMRSSKPSTVKGGGGTTVIPAFTDTFSIAIKTTEENATPTDVDTYAIAYEESDSNAGHTEAVELKFPAGVWGDTNTTPSDDIGFTVLVWLANSAGTNVDNPSNADGQNDGTLATISTAALSTNPEVMTSDIGSEIGTISFSTCDYQGWFRAQTTLITSVITVVAHSTTAAFADIEMYRQATLGLDNNLLDGSFSYDLYAAGVDTLAKLQSLQIIHQTSDAVAGVTPAILTVDAGAVQLTGVIT